MEHNDEKDQRKPQPVYGVRKLFVAVIVHVEWYVEDG